jgi:hypothetical protein
MLWFKIRMALSTLVAIWGFAEIFRHESVYDGRKLLIIAGLSYLFNIAYLLFQVFINKRMRQAK